MNRSEFELVQVHECDGYAEVLIRDKNSIKVYAGNMRLSEDPMAHYPPDYFCAPGCSCAQSCDCQDPDGDGVLLISNGCPVHNEKPDPDPDCPIHG